MTYKSIFKYIQLSKQLEYDDFDFEDEDNETKEMYLRGIKLYDAISNIKYIQKYLFDYLSTIVKNIDINDLFSFLFYKEILDEDYSKLIVEINESISKVDYGHYIFLKDDKVYEKLKKRIESLYSEFNKFE